MVYERYYLDLFDMMMVKVEAREFQLKQIINELEETKTMIQKPTYAELENRVKEQELGAVERRRIEKKLEEKEQTLQALLNAPPESAMLIDLEGKVLAINKVAAQRLGKKQEELIGTVVYDHMSYDLAESRKAQGDKVIRFGKPVFLEDEREGRIYDTNIYPVLNALKKVIALTIHARDVTENKKAEKALRESEEKFKIVAEQSPNMIFINGKDHVVYHNRSCEDILGYKSKDICSPDFDFFALCTPESLELARLSSEKHQNGIEVEPLEYTLLSKDGQRINALISTKLIDYEGEKATLGIVTDITQRKQAEEKIKAYSENLERMVEERTKELEAKTGKLEEINTALNVLLEKRAEDKNILQEQVVSNVKKLTLPYVDKLRKCIKNETHQVFIDVIESSLLEIVSPLSHSLSSDSFGLTPAEIKTADLIRQGKGTKEIAEINNLSQKTVGRHREKIRSKLGIKNKKINLQTYINSLA